MTRARRDLSAVAGAGSDRPESPSRSRPDETALASKLERIPRRRDRSGAHRTVIDDFLSPTGFRGTLAALTAATSGLATKPFDLDSYTPFFREALLRAMTKSWVGLDWATDGSEKTLAMDLELRQVDPSDTLEWRAATASAMDRFAVVIYSGPLTAGPMSIGLSDPGSSSALVLVQALANRAVFWKPCYGMTIPPFGPPVITSDQDVFVVKGQLR